MAASRVLDFTLRMGIVPFFPELAERYGVSFTVVGTLYAAFFLGYAACQLPCGWAADRLPAQRLVALGLVGLGVAGLVFAWTSAWPLALAMRFVMGAALAAVSVPGTRLVSDAFPPDRRGRAFSTVEVVIGASILLAVSGFPLLERWVSVTAVTALLSAAAFPLAAVFWRIKAVGPQPGAQAALKPGGLPRSATAAANAGDGRQIAALLLLGFFGLMVLNAFLGWLPTYLETARQLPKESAALLMAVVLGTYIPSAYVCGWLADRWRRRMLIVNLSTLLMILAFLGLILLKADWALVPVAILLGIGGGWTPASLILFASEALGVARTGWATALMQTAGQLGSALAGILFGAAVDWTGNFDAAWWLAIAILVLRLASARLAVDPVAAPAHTLTGGPASGRTSSSGDGGNLRDQQPVHPAGRPSV